MTEDTFQRATEDAEDGKPERSADPAGDAFRLLRERHGKPVPERPGAAHGQVLGPIRSLGASWDHQRESGKAWADIHPALEIAVVAGGVFRVLFHGPLHCAAWLTESNARFYGAFLAGGLTALVIVIITLAH